ncbi:RHS repeat-associated core domain-containing protein [Chryseobacterium formosense]|uniref:DUF6443 domain-containing protein n=2 Tax=Chryseobacterium formosense TaxID=236814 RepID=UPI0008E00D3A|nr:DUF6443 domain-containing protein [Chryseobacterium formosense]SFT76529.1 RHS repeat-associated core domain-containing protein [Chryseobacterium formosense]
MKKIIIPISALFVAGFSHAQTLNLSTNENYVYTKTYLTDPTGPTPKSVESVQYLDGLGRPKQAVNIKASPLGRDVVLHFVYDQYGRQAMDYLPVPQSGTANGAIVTSPLTNATQADIYGSEIIFSKKEFEASPLDRVLEQRQVGTAWSSKPVKFGYEANENGEVKKYVATFDYASFSSVITLSPTPYGAGQLYKNTVTDEDGNKTIEFKNGQGQVVLVRKMLDATTEADTYYVYNDYNQLAYVIPPLAVAANAVDTTTLNNLCYQYKYDSRNRLVEKKLPGKGWEFMVYDKQDRLVGSQDSNLAEKGQWLFTKYDRFGRVAFTGISTGGDRLTEQADADLKGSNNMNRIESSGFMHEGMEVFYSGRAYPSDSKYVKILSINYYDTYASYSFNPAFPSTVFGVAVISDNSTGNSVSTKSLPVMTLIKNIEDDNWTKNYTWYDSRGRALATHSVNHLGGYTKTESELDFSGTPQTVVTRHKRLNTDTERVITENFTYDHQNRLLTHTHQVDGNAVEYLAQNKYNELSQLESKKVGGVSANSPLQQMDYKYNIRGWMTGINNPNDLSGGDLFGYEIKYNNPENTGLTTGRFNGNIAEIDWKTSTVVNDSKRRYSYVYDGLNRLSQGIYTEPGSSILNNNNYNEYLTYDLNGNIKTLQRYSKPTTGITAEQIDDLVYNYTGNRLDQITLPPGVSNNYSGYNALGGAFAYDSNGNMKSHGDKGLGSIGYNHLSLPNTLTVGSGIKKSQVNYVYRADGTKLMKTTGGGAFLSNSTTDYLDGFQYFFNNDFIICIDCPAPAIGPELQFVPTAEGYFDFMKNKYIYNYADHLGNTRLSYFHNGSGVEVLEENNYYPFGLKHEGYNQLSGNPGYQYKYNGKELQNETGMYDYGARFYMPDIGRWGVVDPLTEKMRKFSPYNYAWDNPIRFIDPDGMWPYPVITRSFAPFPTFGGGFSGDRRGYSTSQNVTSRLSHSYVMNTDNHTYTNYGASSSPSSHPYLGAATANNDVGTISNAVYTTNKDGSTTTSWTAKMAGSNPLTPGGLTPDIDVTTNFSLTENKAAGILGISVKQTGDAFPSAETMIGDTAGNQLMVGVSPAVGNPIVNLFGDNNRPMMSNNFTVTMDENGVFTGVQQGDKTYSVGDWNKMYESSNTVKIPEQQYLPDASGAPVPR